VTRAAPLIVVADDDPDIVMLVSAVLAKSGFEVARATNGTDALELVRTRGPDLAVLDISMPNLDGIEVLKFVRSNPETAELPVILLSARAQEADVKNGYAVGASKYMRKPFSPSELVAVVRELLPDQDGGFKGAD
jgi:DNA-binding response OmpR family regulator